MSDLRTAVLGAPAQQPPWSSPVELAEVCARLRARPPLVTSAACHALHDELATVAAGEGFVVQAGDCAERFADSYHRRVHRKVDQLDQLAGTVERRLGTHVVRIGRLAGQYGKPRSEAVERLADGRTLPVYRGDAVNSPDPSPAARCARPFRLLLAYHHAAACLDTLFRGRPAGLYTSHEALLLDFEHALVRSDAEWGGEYASSAHQLWIGERTRAVDGAHLAFAEQVSNPVGVKIGPRAAPEDVAAITSRLCGGRPAGRLALITRMGADAVADRLPTIVDAIGPDAKRIVWLCDPMHGNTKRTRAGQKTRVLSDILHEIRQFFAVLRGHRLHPGGLHLEVTADLVTECVATERDLATSRPLPRYRSACDPRLNPEQADQVINQTLSLT